MSFEKLQKIKQTNVKASKPPNNTSLYNQRNPYETKDTLNKIMKSIIVARLL